MQEEKKPNCPYCGSDDVYEIVYGPCFELKKGQVSGGCIVTDNSPRWRCLECGYGWDEGTYSACIRKYAR